jgi:hypothetical protein
LIELLTVNKVLFIIVHTNAHLVHLRTYLALSFIIMR